MRRVGLIGLALLLASCATTPPSSEMDGQEAALRAMVRSMGLVETAQQAMWDKFEEDGSNQPAGMEAVLHCMTSDRAGRELAGMMVAVYRPHFSEDEARLIADFYSSKVGQDVISAAHGEKSYAEVMQAMNDEDRRMLERVQETAIFDRETMGEIQQEMGQKGRQFGVRVARAYRETGECRPDVWDS